MMAACAELSSSYETPPPRAAGSLSADRRGAVRALQLHAGRAHGARVVEGDPAVVRRTCTARAAVSVPVAARADGPRARPPGREQDPGGDPLPRGAGDGPRQGRRDRQAPYGAEDAVPRRGR